MTQQIAYRFIEALNALEETGEVEPIVSTFTEACEIGAQQPRDFWRNYRSAYRNIHSTFRNIVIGDNSIALEWTATGVNRQGREFNYDGVTILETVGSRITHFRTYFDSAAMQHQMTSVAVH